MATRKLTPNQASKVIESLAKTQRLPPYLIRELMEKFVQGDDIVRVTRNQLKVILERVQNNFEFAQVDPGSAVGTVAAQSIGEPGTQMSLPGDELVLIRSGKTSRVLPIGDFIDELVQTEMPYAMDRADDEQSVVLDIPEELELYVPGLGTDEQVRWQRLLQVSRHLPNGELLRITTLSGRSITATFSHSFVVRDDNRIVPIQGKKLSIGDRLPLVLSLPAETPLRHLELADNCLSNDKRIMQRTAAAEMVAVTSDDTAASTTLVAPRSKDMPSEPIPLDFNAGWFMGACLAQRTIGRSASVTITFDEPASYQRIHDFARSAGIDFHATQSKTQSGSNSTSATLNSSSLSKIVARILGDNTSSTTKQLPSWVFNTEDAFASGLLRAFFDAKATVDLRQAAIIASSKSKQIRDAICLLLSRLGVFASKAQEDGEFMLKVPRKYALRFKESIGSDIASKREDMERLVSTATDTRIEDNNAVPPIDEQDMIPGIGNIFEEINARLGIRTNESVKAFTAKQLIDREELGRQISTLQPKAMESDADVSDELAILEQAHKSGVIWDPIVKLETIPSPTEFVYDFSVSELETFVTFEGLVTHNTLRTFHYAGVAEFSVTQGLPRLIEIVDARKNPSTPMMTVHLEEEVKGDSDAAKRIAHMIEHTTLQKVIATTKTNLFDNNIEIELSKTMMKEKGLKADYVARVLENARKGIKVTLKKPRTLIIDPPEKERNVQAMQTLLEKLREATLRGFKGVNRAKINKHVSTNPETGEEEIYYSITTEGSSFVELLKIHGVDATRCYTTNPHEIMETLGIEAARNAIIREALKVLQDQGLDVDERHVKLCADLMTTTGEIRQIGRHGISGEKSSVFARAAFEVTVKHLLQAATLGEMDPLKGITENVIVGQAISLGTGIVELLMSSWYREFAEESPAA